MRGYEFESCWSHLNFRYCTYFEEEVAEFLDIQATVEYRFTQKCSCEMIRTHKVQSFTFWVMGKASPHLPKFAQSLPPGKIPHRVDAPPPPPPPKKKKNTHTHQKSISPHPPNNIFKVQPNKNVIFCCSHCSCTIFMLISYSLDTQVMLILILIHVQYSQKAVFSFEKGLNNQNHSLSSSHDFMSSYGTPFLSDVDH